MMNLELIGVRSNCNAQYAGKTFDEKIFEIQGYNSNKQPSVGSYQQTNPNQSQQQTLKTYLKRSKERIRVKKLELEAIQILEEAEKFATDTLAHMNRATTNKSPSSSSPHTNTEATIDKNSPLKPAAMDVFTRCFGKSSG